MQDGLTNTGVVSKPLPLKLIYPVSPLRRLDQNQQRGRSQTEQAWFELQSQKMQRHRGWGLRRATYPLPQAQVRSKSKPPELIRFTSSAQAD